MAKSKKTQQRSQPKSKGGKQADRRPRNDKPAKVGKKNNNVAKAVEAKANKEKKQKGNTKEKKSKMSVEDFFNGGFEDDDDKLDKELENMETIQEDADDDVSDSEPEQQQQQLETDDASESEPDLDQDMIDDEAAVSEAEEEEEDGPSVDEEEEPSIDEEASMDEEADSSDEDDDEQDVKDSKKKLTKDIEKHKKELEELKKRDPEFYKYLQKEENDLLDFDESADEIADDDDEQDEQEDDNEASDVEMEDATLEESDEENDPFSDDLELLTKKKASALIEQVESSKSLQSMKKLLLAFKTAARMSDEEQQEGVSFVYKIDDPKVFNMIVTGTMRNAPIVFNHALKSKTPNASPRWHVCQGAVKSYLINMLHLMRGLTDSDMLYVAAREAEKCSAYWVTTPKMAKDYLKVLLELWSAATSSDNLRIQSFLAIRSLAVARVHKSKPNTYLDMCLKNIYLTFVRNCKGTNEHTLPSINLMRNLATQLYAVDMDLSYQQAFVYIRQLAMHLRNAMQLKSKESYQTVYNWQFIHCIDFWSNVLAANSADASSPLHPLVYPLTQVALGAIQLVPTAQYLPVRFHIVRSMIILGRSTKVYIPLAPYLMQVLESPELTSAAKPSTLKPLLWDIQLRAPKQYLHGRVYQEGIYDQLCECISEYYKSYAYHISFPEMVIPSIVAMKRFVKKRNATKTGSIKGNKKLLNVAAKLELKTNFVLTQRAKADFAPADQEKVAQFVEDMRRKLQ